MNRDKMKARAIELSLWRKWFDGNDSLDFHTFENKVVEAAAKVSLATVYQKHSFLRTRKWMYRR